MCVVLFFFHVKNSAVLLIDVNKSVILLVDVPFLSFS